MSPHAISLPGDGLTLMATSYGSPADPAVVLLHGGGQTRHAWSSAGRALADASRHAICVDLRGHGDSDWSVDGEYSIDRFAADIRSVVESLDGSPVLVGASLGGLAAMVAVAESERDIATALVLVDVAPRVEELGSKRIRDFMARGIDGFDSLADAARAITEYLPDRPPPKPPGGLRKNLRLVDGRWHWHWDPRFIHGPQAEAAQKSYLDHARFARAAARLSLPVLLVRGQMSDVVTEAGARELQQLVPHAEVVDVAGAGHMVAGDRNDVFNEAVIDFIRRRGGSQ